MTEQEWLKSVDPSPMLPLLRGKSSDRKIRLFQVACCRRVWIHLPDETCREAVLLAERYADGEAKDRQRRAILKQVAPYPAGDNLTAINARSAAFVAVQKTVLRRGAVLLGVAAVAGHAASPPDRRGTEAYKAAFREEEEDEAGLIRCFFGNPFRPIAVDPSWLTLTVTELARAAYEERLLPSGQLDPHRLSVLADALEEAGASGDILSHLRGPGMHVRGCFAVDMCKVGTAGSGWQG
jgi:hypothetical protein